MGLMGNPTHDFVARSQLRLMILSSMNFLLGFPHGRLSYISSCLGRRRDCVSKVLIAAILISPRNKQHDLPWPLPQTFKRKQAFCIDNVQFLFQLLHRPILAFRPTFHTTSSPSVFEAPVPQYTIRANMSSHLHLQFRDVRNKGRLVIVPWEIVQALFNDNKSLQQHLDTLRKTDDTVAKSDVQSTINEAIKAAHTVDRSVSQLRTSCPARFHPSEGPAAKAVFNIPELLENILSNLKGPDLLAAQQTNMLFRDVIDGFSSIQNILGLQPDGQSHFHSPFATGAMDISPPLTLLRPQTRRPNTVMGPICGIQLCVGGHGRAHPSPPLPYSSNHVYVTGRIDSMPTEVGERCLRMLICQPPVREMSIYFCQTNHDSPFSDIRSASSPQREHSFTVADLLFSARLGMEKRSWKQLGRHGRYTRWLE